jgi:transcriptional regulator with XRE-family HTH domain
MNHAVAGNAVINADVAQQIRHLRRQRQLSQRALAEASGLSRNTLSLLERGRTSPTLATLQKIAAALGVDINLFFQGGGRQATVSDPTADGRLDLVLEPAAAEGGYQLEQLIAAHILRLDPECSSGSLPAHSGQEFVYCLTGQCLIAVEDQRYLLKSGDSLHFDGRLSHCCQNPGQEKAEALVILLDVPH